MPGGGDLWARACAAGDGAFRRSTASSRTPAHERAGGGVADAVGRRRRAAARLGARPRDRSRVRNPESDHRGVRFSQAWLRFSEAATPPPPLVERIQGLPGVSSVGLAAALPLESRRTIKLTVDG